MKRRRFLPLVALSPLGAGCLDRAPLPLLDSLWLVNDRDEPHEATVTIDEDGDRLYERTFRLGDGDGGRPANLTEASPVEGPGRYVVTARMDGERTIEVETADFVDGQENCLTVRFTFLNNGSTDWWTRSYREC